MRPRKHTPVGAPGRTTQPGQSTFNALTRPAASTVPIASAVPTASTTHIASTAADARTTPTAPAVHAMRSTQPTRISHRHRATRPARLGALAAAAIVLVSLTGCNYNTNGESGASAITTAPDTPDSSNSPVPTPTAQSAAEEDGEATFDDLTTEEWAKQVIATSISDDEFSVLSGHLDEATSLQSSDTDTTLQPGTYTYHFACRGEGDITFTATNGDAELFSADGPCTNEQEAGAFVATTAGVTVTAISSGEPLDWAFKLTAPKVR
ncbi:MAG: hypothetical protein JWQ43_3466 [Glaciihabitans sp.]|nr:hypothetical protein [Glaciihabitans sp.]